jgi:hypothetical protein
MPPSGSAARSFARPEPPTGWGAVLAATLAASFVLLVFLPTVVYFFNSFFVEYTILEHYAVTLAVTLLVGLAVAAITIIPRAPRGLLVAACRFIVTYIVIAAVFLPSWTPALDGREHFADSLSRASIQSHLLLGVLATGIVILLWRRPASASVLGHAMFVTAMVFSRTSRYRTRSQRGDLFRTAVRGGQHTKTRRRLVSRQRVPRRAACWVLALYGRHSFGCPAQTCIHRPLLLKGLAESILASYLGFFGLRSDAYITDLPCIHASFKTVSVC